MPTAIHEVIPGVLHWTNVHPEIKIEVSSYCLPTENVVIDPLIPPDGLEWFDTHGPPADALLTSGLHLRQAPAFTDGFGCTVRCPRTGLHRLDDDVEVEAYDWGDELADGTAIAIEIGGICPDEGALHLPRHNAVALADGAVRMDGDALQFVPDQYMGDDPAGVKAALKAAYAKLLAGVAFDHLLLAHGTPVVGDGRAKLQAFVTG